MNNNTLNNITPTPQDPQDDPVDVRELVFAILRNWYWIGLCVGLGFLGARFYLRYTVPVYQASGKILIKEEAGGGLTEEAVLQEIGLLKPSNNLENEVHILKSRTLMKEVMAELGLEVEYIGLGRIRNTELYRDAPAVLDSAHWGGNRQSATLVIEVNGPQSFTLIDQETESESPHLFNAPLMVKQDTFWLRHTPTASGDAAKRVLVRIGIGPGRYLAPLQIRPMDDYSSVLNLQIQDPVPEKAVDILNKLVEVYNQVAIDDKNQVAKKTLEFIDERLRLLATELSTVEGGLEQYKERNEIPTEAATTVALILNEVSQYDNELTREQIRLELLRTVEEMLSGDVEQYELIPANIVLEDAGGLDAQIARYNELLLNRERLRRAAGEDNPQLLALNQQLRGMRQNIVQSVQAVRQNLELSIRETQKKLNELQQRINQVPRQERELLEIKRQQNIKEALFLFLLQKKEETALSAAITAPNARVIDAPISSGAPISPKPMQVYAIFLMLSFALPVGLIFVRELLDDKIYSEADIKSLTQAPLLGAIAHNKSGDSIVVKANSRTGIAEMFRLLRTNLNYMGQGERKQTVLITSGMGGDGKTFIAVNLGISLSLAGKRVVILGMDLRKPKLSKYLAGQSDHREEGISNYLVSADMEVERIIQPAEMNDNLFFIPSGPVPPNPAELLSAAKVTHLFEYLKAHFDYLIIDTAPVGLVADAFLLEPYTDISLYAVRYAETPREVIRGLEDMRRDNKLKNPAIVLNGVKPGKGYGYGSRYGYGYGYGYYEDDRKKRHWRMPWRKKTDSPKAQ